MSNDWVKRLAGKFIVLDGPDGCGKSTQVRLLADFVRAQGVEVCQVREPGGTPVGEHIRTGLLNPDHQEMDLRCEMLLYMASRAQLAAQCIRPGLKRGAFVLADRFISSTLAYQGAAGGLSTEDILSVGRVALGDCRPDLVVIFDVDPATATARLAGKPKKPGSKESGMSQTLFSDRLELKGPEYHAKVRQGYLDQAAASPKNHRVMNGRPDPEKVFTAVQACIKGWVDAGRG